MAEQSLPARRALTAHARAPAWVRAVRAHPAAQIALGALALCIPILINGRPFPFEDTSTYVQAGYRVLHAIDPHAGAPTSDFMRAYLGARSPYYGLLITLAARAGGLWAIVALHALMASALLHIATRAITGRLAAFPILIAALTAASALPLFIGFLTPDVTAGFAPLALGLLVFYRARLRVWEKRALWLLSGAALCFHASHLLTALALLPLALLAARFVGISDIGGGARMAGAPIIAAAALGLFAALINANTPAPAYAPPYLTARVLADGPGRLYLRGACGEDETRFALCAFQDRALGDSEKFLWSLDPRAGVFAVSDQPTRLALIAEQNRFVLGAVSHYPLTQARASLLNAWNQLTAIRVDGAFAIDAEFWRRLPPDFYLASMIRPFCPEAKASCPPRLDLRIISAVQEMIFALALIYLAAQFARRRPWRAPANADDSEYQIFAALTVLMLVALVINAALCGSVSGVFPRYQTRIIWLIPALALLAEARFPLLPRAARAR